MYIVKVVGTGGARKARAPRIGGKGPETSRLSHYKMPIICVISLKKIPITKGPEFLDLAPLSGILEKNLLLKNFMRPLLCHTAVKLAETSTSLVFHTPSQV